jgi:hypothetical protein
MSWVAVAIGGAAVVGAVGSGIAGHQQAQGQEAAANTQKYMFDTLTGNEKPFMDAGVGATNRLNELLGLTPGGSNNGYLTQQFSPTQDQLNKYPGYQFALKTGGQAVRNADTPGVGALSGAALKDLMNFNVGTANQYYGQYFNQFQTQQNNIFNRLNSIATLGQNAAGNLGTAGTSLGTGVAQAQAAAAGSTAAGTLGEFNSGSNSLASILAFNGGGGSASGGVMGNTSLAQVPGVTGGSFFGD